MNTVTHWQLYQKRLRLHAEFLSKSKLCALIFSDDDLDEEVLLQDDDYLAQSPPHLNADEPSVTPTLPQTDLDIGMH